MSAVFITQRKSLKAACVVGIIALATIYNQQTHALPEDRQQAIRISADEAVRDEKRGLTIYKGNVRMNQGTLQIAADKITVTDTEGRAQTIVAQGKPAKLQQRPAADQAILYAQARRIEYQNNTGKVRLLRQARIEQDGSKVTGNSIDYDINEHIVKAKAGSNGSGRVEVVIPPHLINNPEGKPGGDTKR
ncbi:MAG: lipopolysaccharide transport periplasmic protein LptA [Gammaproteobacteria bacterium]|nr:MAG: lipopolysaccharide transport periplasmic protein LptA [Gammaproteobacteria bacterium]